MFNKEKQWVAVSGVHACVKAYILLFHVSKVRVKMKLPLCLTKYDAMKTYGGVEVQLYAILTSAPDEVDWSDSRPGHFTPVKKNRYPLDRRLGGLQSRSGCGSESKHDRPASLVTELTGLSQLSTLL